ncbi:hypothetical protein G6L37_06500 [Agrobacterium rubi]|nr:hypothetical protein [Agrobacterium rubi]NTF25013.1 hypothetical protein [Agrobacterium rubi]
MTVSQAIWNGFALIGGAVVGLLVYQLLKETVRAFRQGKRLAYVYARSRGERRPPLKWLWKMILHEFCSSYDWTTVSSWKVPHNPSQPIRRAYYWLS